MPVLPIKSLTRRPALQARYPQDMRSVAVRLPPNVTYAAGQVLAEATTAAARNEVQTLTVTGTPTGGNVPLTVPGRGTVNIAYNSTAAAAQTLMDGLIGAGNVTVSGGALPGTALVFTFGGEYGNRDVAAMTVVSTGLTGGTTPAAAIAETTKGSAGSTEVMTAVNSGASDGTEKPKGILEQDVQTDEKGCVLDEWGVGSNNVTASMLIAGEYQCAKLTGLHANHVTNGHAQQFGRLTSGNAITDAEAVIKINA